MNSTTITDLLSKIDALDGTKIELIAERDELSFAALVERDKKSAARIAEINSKLEGMHSEAATLKAALAEARRREQVAEAAEAADTERMRLEKAMPIVDRLEARGEVMDRAIAAYVENFKAIQDDLTELTRLGVPVPGRELIAVNANRAHDSALTPLGDKFVRPVPPTMRRTFTFLLKNWALLARKLVESKLNNKPAAEAA
jgi:hypothetical protein